MSGKPPVTVKETEKAQVSFPRSLVRWELFMLLTPLSVWLSSVGAELQPPRAAHRLLRMC